MSDQRPSLLSSFVTPLLVALIGIGGPITGAEIESHHHECEPKVVVTTVSKHTPGKADTETVTRQVTSCPTR